MVMVACCEEEARHGKEEAEEESAACLEFSSLNDGIFVELNYSLK